MEKTKEERNKVFIEWVTFTEDRVNEWKENITKELADKLDWTPESLPLIEKYAIENYTIADQEDKKKRIALDAIVSYVGDVIRKNIPEVIWKIDLDDKTNIFYNLPYLVFKMGVPICPHHLVQDALKDKTGSEFTDRFNQRFKKWQQYKAHMDSKKS
jgi:hypothetical protein